MKLGTKNILFLFTIIMLLNSCRMSYSFNGGSVPVEAQNFSVEYFTNKAPQADPKYSRELSEELIDLLNSQTRLDYTEEDGDIRYQGQLITYTVAPVAVSNNESSAQERLTIGVKMNYVNTLDPELNVETTVSRFRDYDPNENFDSIEDDLVTEIIKELVQDIYDKSLGNW